MLLLLLACQPAVSPLAGVSPLPPAAVQDTADTADTGLPDDGDYLGLGAALLPEIESVVVVRWTQDEPGVATVRWQLDGEWQSAPPTDGTAGEHRVLLLGIPYDTEVDWQITGDLGESEVYRVRTAPLPEGFPAPALFASEPDLWEPTGRYLLGSVNATPGGWVGGNFWKFLIDRQGRVVWALLTPDNHWSIQLHVSRDGDDILWDEATYWCSLDEGAGSQVHRMKIDGSIVETVPTPGLHHPFTELSDGSIAWGAANGWDESLEVRSPEGEQRRLWDCQDFEDSIELADFCQSNTLTWDPAQDRYLFSFFSGSFVVEIDGATGETSRVFGDIATGWSFDPVDSVFDWQHGANYTEAGTLLLSTHLTPDDKTTLVREYELDQDTRTLRQVWSYGVDDPVEAPVAGEAHRLPNGDTLHNLGSGSLVREITPDGQVVWGLSWEGGRLLGRTVFVDDLYAFAP